MEIEKSDVEWLALLIIGLLKYRQDQRRKERKGDKKKKPNRRKRRKR